MKIGIITDHFSINTYILRYSFSADCSGNTFTSHISDQSLFSDLTSSGKVGSFLSLAVVYSGETLTPQASNYLLTYY